MKADEATRKKVAAMVAFGASYSQAAECCGVAMKTVYRWMREDDFRQSVRDMQGAIDEISRLRLNGLIEEAWDTVAKSIRGGDARLALDMLKNTPALAKAAEEPEETKSEVSAESMLELVRKIAETSPHLLEAELKRARETGEPE